MDTLVDPTPTSLSPRSNKYFGRPKGAKNKRPSIQIRFELERCYQRMHGFDGLYQWAMANPTEFYPIIIKILGAFELKAEEQTHEPIRVVVYGGKDTKVIEASASCTAPGSIDRDEIVLANETCGAVDNDEIKAVPR